MLENTDIISSKNVSFKLPEAGAQVVREGEYGTEIMNVALHVLVV